LISRSFENQPSGSGTEAIALARPSSSFLFMFLLVRVGIREWESGGSLRRF
jgi:hypothetical protein